MNGFTLITFSLFVFVTTIIIVFILIGAILDKECIR